MAERLVGVGHLVGVFPLLHRRAAVVDRVGQFGGKQDVANDWLAVQCKVGGSFSERQWDWLQTVPVKSDQLRGLVIGDSPGVGGGRRRAVIILDLDDFCDWFVAAEPPE